MDEEADATGPGECIIDQVLGQRWRIRRRVGRGTFSEIYEASDLHQDKGTDGRHPHVAVKVARGDGQKRSMLEHEEEVLETLQACKAVPRFVARAVAVCRPSAPTADRCCPRRPSPPAAARRLRPAAAAPPAARCGATARSGTSTPYGSWDGPDGLGPLVCCRKAKRRVV
jgi:hypothetical protein